MAEYTLYCFAQSGNAYKPALMLALCGADWAPRFVDFFNGETRTPAYRQLNPMGEVPVLVHGERTLSQSGVILDYLAERFGRFGPRDEEERREILRWLLFDNHKLTANIATYRYLLRFMRTGETPVTEFLAGRMRAALKVLDGHLAGREWVVGDRPTWGRRREERPCAPSCGAPSSPARPAWRRSKGRSAASRVSRT